jgi:hypothetical protein
VGQGFEAGYGQIGGVLLPGGRKMYLDTKDLEAFIHRHIQKKSITKGGQ